MLNKTEKLILKKVIRRLRGHCIADDLKSHLDALRIYLDSWVIRPLELLATRDEESDPDKRATMLRDARNNVL